VDEIDMAIEGIGQVEPHLPTADQLDVFRQFHSCVLLPPASCPHHAAAEGKPDSRVITP
jgi:hypothetical protein